MSGKAPDDLLYAQQSQEPSWDELKARLRETEETLDAIRNGEVDALVVGGPSGQRVYTLENADRPYRVLIEQMQEGALTLSDDGTVLYCNQRFAAIVEAPRESIIGSPLPRFVMPIEHKDLLDLLRRSRGGGVSGEFTLRSSGSLEIPVNISLVDLRVEAEAPRIVCAVVTDLSHARRRTHELAAANANLAREIEERRRAEDGLQLALDAAGMASWDFDLASGLFWRSPRHDTIFGYGEPLPEWRLAVALDHFEPEDRSVAEAAFAAAPITGALEFVLRIRRSGDGARRWIHVKGKTHFESGHPVRIAGVVADVTEARQTEEELRQAQKMDAVGQLTGGVAHDFNNLLMIIGGSLDMISRRISSDEKTGRVLDAARQGVARGAKLTQQLLAFSRRQDLNVEAICLNDLISGFTELLQRAVGETITVAIDAAPDLWSCRTDAHQLETAILNLVINARDAMPKGGLLRLTTENRGVSGRFARAFDSAPGDYVAISIADSGVGMAPEVAQRAFEPFFTTKEVGAGTGLGLSQVYGFARQSGGFVTIESELGHGATIQIYLPRCAPRESLASNGVGAAAQLRGRGTILIVEDDRDVRATTSAMLEDLGYEVRQADSGARALAMLEEDPGVDLVFTDVILPNGMGGLDLARELERRRLALPVLLTSGYTAQKFAEHETGHLQLLRKPYELATLSQAIASAFNARERAPQG